MLPAIDRQIRNITRRVSGEGAGSDMEISSLLFSIGGWQDIKAGVLGAEHPVPPGVRAAWNN